MAVETRSAWVAKAEAAVAALRGVDDARIQADGDEVTEIHVISTSKRPAKQIVRDVQSVLLARFGREIDYRVVSVAYCDPAVSPPAIAPDPRAGDVITPASSPAVTEPSRGAGTPAPSSALVRDDRIRFVGVNLFVSGARTQAQVELRWKGLPRMGSASGWSTRDGAHRLVAQATLAALQEFLADEIALAIDEVQLIRLGRRRVVLVSVALVAHREEKLLSGSCVADHDLQEAVVLATLSALNRLAGGLRVKEATEYVLRPTST